MDISEAIQHAKEVACNDGDCAYKHKQLANWLTELKQRRESDLRPANKYLGNSWLQQYMHIQEELNEVKKEMSDYALEYTGSTEFIIIELIDLQMSCETLITILGLDEQQRREARRKVIEKNEARGYYKDGVESES